MGMREIGDRTVEPLVGDRHRDRGEHQGDRPSGGTIQAHGHDPPAPAALHRASPPQFFSMTTIIPKTPIHAVSLANPPVPSNSRQIDRNRKTGHRSWPAWCLRPLTRIAGSAMKLPRNFYQPMAIGAPEPRREPPVRLERMIHFVPPHVEKLRAKVPELVGQVDVLLGNLEDAIPADAKEAARRGFIAMAKAVAFGATGLWTRINALNSPWALDDVTEIVAAVGNKLDVIMLPKVEGAWDIHYLDQLLAQLEARHHVSRPILIHAILETAEGVNNVETIAAASPRMHGISLGPADLAASRAMKTTRVGGGHPDYVVLADAKAGGGPDGASDLGFTRDRHYTMRTSATADVRWRAVFQQDLWHYTIAKMVDACA